MGREGHPSTWEHDTEAWNSPCSKPHWQVGRVDVRYVGKGLVGRGGEEEAGLRREAESRSQKFCQGIWAWQWEPLKAFK